jgi:hypothetical protein
MAAVMIGVDPYMGSHTAVVIGATSHRKPDCEGQMTGDCHLRPERGGR